MKRKVCVSLIVLVEALGSDSECLLSSYFCDAYLTLREWLDELSLSQTFVAETSR